MCLVCWWVWEVLIAWAVVSTLAGGVSGTNKTYSDGSGTDAGFNWLTGVAVDASGNMFVADQNNHRIRKVTAGGGTRIELVAVRALALRTVTSEAPAQMGWALLCGRCRPFLFPSFCVCLFIACLLLFSFFFSSIFYTPFDECNDGFEIHKFVSDGDNYDDGVVEM
jgi:hypothetical protein